MPSLRYLLALLFIGSAVARAQTVVAGLVTDRSNGSVLSKVVVELLNRADSVVATDTTRADGTFTLNTSMGGSYRIRLTPDGAQSSVSDSIVVETNGYAAHQFPITIIIARAYQVSEVDRPATPAPGYRSPRYPVDLRGKGVSGCVVAEFVVDEQGRVDMRTFTVIRATHAGFAQAVRDALSTTQYVPARLGGRDVRQLVRAPYDFSIVTSRNGQSNEPPVSSCK